MIEPIPFAPGYFVSDWGQVFSDLSGLRRRLSQVTTRDGYRTVALRGTRIPVHRLVCLVFQGSPPSESCVVRHLNGDPADNRARNLTWGTQRDNMADMVAHGRSNRGRRFAPRDHDGARNPRARLSPEDVDDVRGRLAQGQTQTAIAKRFGVSRQTITAIKTGQNWK